LWRLIRLIPLGNGWRVGDSGLAFPDTPQRNRRSGDPVAAA